MAAINCFTTAQLCESWKTAHERMMEEPDSINQMMQVENELERRFPLLVDPWRLLADTNYELYSNPGAFFIPA